MPFYSAYGNENDEGISPLTSNKPEVGASFLDPAKKLASSAVEQFVTTPLASAQYGAEQAGNVSTARLFRSLSTLTGLGSKYIDESMSEGGRRAADAAFLPDDNQASVAEAPLSSFVMKTAGMAPGLAIMYLFPSSLIGQAISGGGLQAANVVQRVIQQTNMLSDEELQRQSPVYKHLREDEGLDEDGARGKLHKMQITGTDLAIAAVAGAAGMVPIARTLKGQTATDGILKGATKGAVNAGVGMGIGSAQQDAAEQNALVVSGQQKEMDWHRSLMAGLNATLEGGVLGGTLGGIHGRRAPAKAGEAVPDTGETAAPKLEIPGVETVPEVGGDAAQNLAAQQALKVAEPTTAVDEFTAPKVDAPTEPKTVETPPPVAETPTTTEVSLEAPLRQGEATPEGSSKETTVPEADDSIEAQVKRLAEGKRTVVMFPKDLNPADRPPRPKNTNIMTIPDVGTFYYDRTKVNQTEIRTAARTGRLNDYLEMGPTSKVDAANEVAQGAEFTSVVAREPDTGTPVVEQVSTTKSAPADVAVVKEKNPDLTVAVENPNAVLAERQAAAAQPVAEPTPPVVAKPVVEKKAAPAKKPAKKAKTVDDIIAEVKAEEEGLIGPVTPYTVTTDGNGKRVFRVQKPEDVAIDAAMKEKLAANKAALEAAEALAKKTEKEAAAGYVEGPNANKGSKDTTRNKARQENNSKSNGLLERFVTPLDEKDRALNKGQKKAEREASGAARRSIVARARAAVAAANELGFQWPVYDKNASEQAAHSPSVAWLRAAKAVAESPDPGRKLFESFLTKEEVARGGGKEAAKLLRDMAAEEANDLGKGAKKPIEPVNEKNDEVNSGEGPRITTQDAVRQKASAEDNLNDTADYKLRMRKTLVQLFNDAKKANTPVTQKQLLDMADEIVRTEIKAEKAAEKEATRVTTKVTKSPEQLAKEAERKAATAALIEKSKKNIANIEAGVIEEVDAGPTPYGWDVADTSVPRTRRDDPETISTLRKQGYTPKVDETISSVWSDVNVRTIASGLARDVLTKLKPSGVAGYNLLVNRLRALAGEVKLYVVDDADFARLASMLRADAPAYYDPNYGHIVVRADYIADVNNAHQSHVVLHEVVHAATVDTINNVEQGRGTPAQIKAYGELKALMEHLITDHGDRAMVDVGIRLTGKIKDHYGFTNMKEFISEAYSNPEFQNYLMRTSMPRPAGQGQVTSMFRYMVETIRKMLNFTTTRMSAMEALVRASDDLFAPNMDTAARKTRRGDDYFNKPDAITREAVTNYVTEWSKDRSTNFGGTIRRFGNKLSTFTQLGDRAARLFPEKEDRFLTAPQQVAEYHRSIQTQKANWMAKSGGADEILRNLSEAKRKYENAPEWQRFIDVAHDATIANINLDYNGVKADNSHLGKDATRGWWSKAQIKEIQTAFDSLPKDLQKNLMDTSEFFKRTQDEMSLSIADNLLDALSINKPGLAKAILDGRFDEKTAPSFGIDPKSVAFTTLNDVKGLRAIGGVYFPLMRRGEFVVNGKVNFETPAKAHRLDEDTIIFRDDTSAGNKQAAKDFIKSSSIAPENVKKVWLDKTNLSKEVEPQDLNAVRAYKVRLERQHTEFFETEAEANRAADALRKQGLTEVYATRKQNDTFTTGGSATPTQLATLKRSLEQRKGYKDLSPEAKTALLNSLVDAQLRLMSTTRIQTKRIARRNISGYSDDITVNAAQYSSSAGNYLARMKQMPKIEAALKDMREYIAATKDSTIGVTTKRQEIYNDMEKRVYSDADTQPQTKMDNLINRVLQVSGINKLAGVSFHVVNSLEPAMSAMPLISGRHGFVRASATMAKVYNVIGAGRAVVSGIRDTGLAFRKDSGFTNYIDGFKSNFKGHESAARWGQLLDHLHDVGLLDKDAGFETQRNAKPNSNLAGRALDRAELMARQVGTAIEAINRTVSGITAYELEYKRSGDHEGALRYAQRIVHDSMGDYASSNAAPIFNHPIGRLALQFRKFGQKMYYLLGSTIGRAVRGDAEATKQFIGLMFTHATVAGVLGLPTEPIKVALLAANAVGATSFDMSDLERYVRSTVAGVVGDTAGEVITRGIPRYFGMDLSSRVGMDSLLTYGEPRSMKDNDIKTYLFNTIAGAPASMLVDQITMMQMMSQGEYLKGAEKLPIAKAGVDIIRATRLTTEGKVSSSGRETMAPLTPGEAILKGIGIRPAREAETSERNNAFYKQQSETGAARKKIMADWVRAAPNERAKMWGKVEKFNKDLPPEARITRSQLDQQVRRVATDKVKSQDTNGLVTNKRTKYLADNLDFYNTDR